MSQEQEQPSRKARMMAADFNYFRDTCGGGEATALALVTGAHTPLALGSRHEWDVGRSGDLRDLERYMPADPGDV